MKLLILTNNPNRAGFRQRIEIYLETLRRNGIHCEVAKFPPGELARLRFFKRAADFDGVFLQKKGLNFFNAVWLRRYSKKIIYDFDDAVMYSPRHPDHNSSSHFRPWQRSVRLADMVLAGNSYLAELARKFNPTVEVLPTGLDTSSYKLQPCSDNDERIRLVWIGSKATLRYLVEIKPVLEEIGSRFNNVVLRIICDEFFELQNIKVEKCRWSKEAEGIDLVSSDIGLAPLPDNRFTRGKCGFKILQYACAGLAVVASPVGVNCDYVRNNITGLFATDTRQWIAGIIQLIENRQLRKGMGVENLAVAKNFDISVMGGQLVGLIKKCLGNVRT